MNVHYFFELLPLQQISYKTSKKKRRTDNKFPRKSLPRESKYQVSKFSSKSLRKSLSKLEGNRRNQSAKKDHPEEAKQKGRTSPTKQLHQKNPLPREQVFDKAIPPNSFDKPHMNNPSHIHPD